MATSKEFERHLSSRRFSDVKLDTSNRALRKAKQLPGDGRGPHAKDIGPREAATMILANLGSLKAVRSLARFEALQALPDGDGRTLLDALTECLESDASVSEVRVSRLRRRAVIRWTNGSESVFASRKAGSAMTAGLLEVEGVLNEAFFRDARAVLRGESPPPAPQPEELEDGE